MCIREQAATLELQSSCKMIFWSLKKNFSNMFPRLLPRRLSPSINSTLFFLKDSCIIYGRPPQQIIICSVVFTSKI